MDATKAFQSQSQDEQCHASAGDRAVSSKDNEIEDEQHHNIAGQDEETAYAVSRTRPQKRSIWRWWQPATVRPSLVSSDPGPPPDGGLHACMETQTTFSHPKLSV